jgi:DUF1680 family protein
LDWRQHTDFGCMLCEGEMFLTTGDTWYADRLEQIAYNALPAAFMNGTMWSLNYFQQVNKLDAIDGCEKGCTYCFGMVYECCVSNHVQGWPKFAARQFALVPTVAQRGSPLLRTQTTGLALVQYFSSTSSIDLGNGNKVDIILNTSYPFEEQVYIDIEAPEAFKLSVRVPAWCHQATIASSTGDPDVTSSTLPAGSMAKVTVPRGSSSWTLNLPMKIRVARRPAYKLNASVEIDTNAANIYRGPVLYAIARDFTLDHSKP